MIRHDPLPPETVRFREVFLDEPSEHVDVQTEQWARLANLIGDASDRDWQPGGFLSSWDEAHFEIVEAHLHDLDLVQAVRAADEREAIPEMALELSSAHPELPRRVAWRLASTIYRFSRGRRAARLRQEVERVTRTPEQASPAPVCVAEPRSHAVGRSRGRSSRRSAPGRFRGSRRGAAARGAPDDDAGDEGEPAQAPAAPQFGLSVFRGAR